MLDPNARPVDRRDHNRADRDLEPLPASRPLLGEVQIRTVYFATAEATVNAGFAPRKLAFRNASMLLEVPADQYEVAVRLVAGTVNRLGAESPAPTLEGTPCLRRGTVSYKQALRVARAGRIDGVGIDPETSAILCDFPYGLSFALEYAHARWSGGTERAAVARALVASLKAGPSSAVHGLLAARLGLAGRGSAKAATAEGALSGVANSPFGHGAAEGALRTLSIMAGPVSSGHLGLLAGAGPIASTVAIGVANLDFYRAALQRSISWTQFTKNMAIKTSSIVVGAGGWASGAVLGSAVGGPIGALLGGIAGALSGGSLGAAGAKRVADRFIDDDATRLMAIVRQGSEELAFEYLLNAGEIDRFAARIKMLVTAAWLRRMFQTARTAAKSGDTDGSRASRRFAHRELDKICREIVALRPRIALPSAGALNVLLEEIGLLEPSAMYAG